MASFAGAMVAAPDGSDITPRLDPAGRLRTLLGAPTLTPERVFYHAIGFRGHTNPRYRALLPRLSRVDPYLLTCSDRRLLRGAEYRALRATRRLRYRSVFALAARHYCFAFSTDMEQAPFIRCPVVFDVDDPTFTQEEARLLNLPHVRAFVVTAERAAARYRDLGVRTPHHVIPQGIERDAVDPAQVRQIEGTRHPDEVVVGYIAAWLLAAGDRGGDNPLYNVDHLLDLWEAIRPAAPRARLWLVGGASDEVRRRCGGRDDIRLLGRLPAGEALAAVANFDIGLYARTADQGIQAAKVAEYLGMGVPVVSYDYEVTSIVGESGAGILARTPRDFVDAVATLATDDDRRRAYAAAAEAAGRSLDWRFLAERYEREIFDVHLR